MAHARSIAVAQTVPVAGDVDANIQQHLRLAHLAANAQPHVLLFPELSLTGYEIGLAERLAFTPDDARLEPLRAEAASASTTFVVGAPARIGAKLHIGAFVLRPDGTTDLYTKRHLGAFSDAARVDGTVPPAEATMFEPGDLDPLVQIGSDRAAIAICADTGRAVHARAAAERGARIYLASMFVIRSDMASDVERLRSYAVEHSMTVAMANFAGSSGGLAAGGGSAIWSADGEPVVQLAPNGAGVGIATDTGTGWRGTVLV